MPTLRSAISGPRRPTRTLTVVIVEDHHAIRAALRMLIDSSADVQVAGEAESVVKAGALIDGLRPDVVLLDRRLNGEDGLDVARRLRREGRTEAILVLSASDTAADLREALDAGVDGFLSKSVPSATLLDGIRRVAGGETVINEEVAYTLVRRTAAGSG